MTQKLKIALGIVLFLIFIMGATLAYNLLSDMQIESHAPIELSENDSVIESKEDIQKQKAPDFSMVDQEGNTVRLSDFIATGKPVVLNFWASWCPPCKSEMPDFDNVYKELGDEIQFMMVNLTDGQRETIEIGSKYVEEQGFSFPIFFDTKYEGNYAYGIRSIPTTLFIDKEGYLASQMIGAIDEAVLRQQISLIH